MSKGFQIAGGATAIALLFAWYAWAQLDGEGSFAYYQSIEEFQKSKVAQQGEPARVHGYVVPGSIIRDVVGGGVAFRIQNEPPKPDQAEAARTKLDAGPQLPVVFNSLETPDLFGEGAEVVVEGRAFQVRPLKFRFDADKVMAKCPSKFEGVEEGAQPG